MTSCTPEEQADVVILHTGRLRGNVFPPGSIEAMPLQYYQQLAGYLKTTRAEFEEKGVPVFMVDLGDSLGGSFSSLATDHATVVTFLNLVGYDAVALGNLDADVTAEVIASLDMPVLCPFVDATGQLPYEGLEASTVLNRLGVSLELVSNFYGDTPLESAPHRFPAWFGENTNGIQARRDYSDLSEAGADLRVLSWMRFEGEVSEDFLQVLQDKNVDLAVAHRISSGRDAWSAENFFPWAVPVTQNLLRENRGFTVSRVELKRDGDGWRVLRHELVTMNTPDLPRDQDIELRLESFATQIRDADAVLTTLEATASREAVLEHCLACFTQVDGVNAVLYSIESIRDSLAAGEVRASQLYTSMPWTGELVKVVLSGEQVKELAGTGRYQIAHVRSTNLDAPDALTLMTSRYFAQLIKNQFQLPSTALEVLPGTSEFQAFRDALAKSGVLNLPSDWIVYEP